MIFPRRALAVADKDVVLSVFGRYQSLTRTAGSNRIWHPRALLALDRRPKVLPELFQVTLSSSWRCIVVPKKPNSSRQNAFDCTLDWPQSSIGLPKGVRLSL